MDALSVWFCGVSFDAFYAESSSNPEQKLLVFISVMQHKSLRIKHVQQVEG